MDSNKEIADRGLEYEVDLEDLEAAAKSGSPPRRAKQYRLRIDREHFTVEKPVLTGRELLTMAGKVPVERFMLSQKLKGGRTDPVGLDDKVDLTTPGVERFMTLPKDQTEGETVRRQFHLPEADVEYLESLGRPWETVIDGGTRWVLLHQWPVPAGYNRSEVSLAVRIEPGYPDAQLDMVYFFPALARRDGVGINALSNQSISGQSWQRWSRHRTGANPWRPGLDDLSTHLLLVDDWLAREFRRAA